MKLEAGCGCHQGMSRREVLQGGLAAAVTAVGGVSDALAQPAAKTGVRAIDIHAHYFPQAYFDLFNAQDRRFDSEFHMTEQGFFFKTPPQTSRPLPSSCIDLQNRPVHRDY